MQHRQSHLRGFTLIELLVVVAIIVALIAILLPSMNQAINIAVSATCQSNQRQVMYATINYASDNFGLLPPQHAAAIKWMSQTSRDHFDPYINNVGATFFCPTLDPADQMKDASIGSANNGKDAQWYWDKPTTWGGGRHLIGYFYMGNPWEATDPNKLWKDVEGQPTVSDDYVTRVSGDHSPAAVVVADILPRPASSDPDNWFFRHPPNSIEETAWINVAFIDGHAESRTNAEAVPRHGSKNGQTSPIGW